MIGLFPQDDPDQVIIIKRFFIAFGSYALAIGFGFFSVMNGDSLLSVKHFPFILLGVALSNLYFYLVIRTGANKKYADKSLTLPQIFVALAWMLCLMFADAENRGLFISVYTMIMMFGVFRLRRAEMVKVSLLAFLGYIVIATIDYTYFNFRFDLARESLRGAILFGMLTWATLFAGHVSDLRATLRRRNRDLSAALEEIGILASRDHLTKAYNRRYIMEALDQEKMRADRTSSTFSICILDLDHFKRINDRYGHLTGDRVLMAFCERIKGALRGMDLVDTLSESRFFGRYGGEEFIVVLPDTNLAGAMRCGERIRRVTADESFDDVFRVTLSAGVSQYRYGETIEETLRRADSALYGAKNRGRNRVISEDPTLTIAQGPPPDDTSSSNIVVGPFAGKQN